MTTITLPHLSSIRRITTGCGLRDGDLHAEIIVVYEDRDIAGQLHERSCSLPIPSDGMTAVDIDAAMSRLAGSRQ